MAVFKLAVSGAPLGGASTSFIPCGHDGAAPAVSSILTFWKYQFLYNFKAEITKQKYLKNNKMN